MTNSPHFSFSQGPLPTHSNASNRAASVSWGQCDLGEAGTGGCVSLTQSEASSQALDWGGIQRVYIPVQISQRGRAAREPRDYGQG